MPAPAHNLPSPNALRVVRAGLIGAGIAASRTPRMHIEEGRAQGINYAYELIDTDTMTTAPDIDTLLTQAQARGLDGVNVTFPFKRTALAHVDEIAASAAAVGATNAIVFHNGRRIAHNTDYSGFSMGFLRQIGARPHATALLLGAGGAGGAVANALLDAGVHLLFIHDKDAQAVKTLAATLDARLGLGRVRAVTDMRIAAAAADGIVNATPVGMVKQPGTPLDMALVEARHWVVDIVYFPLVTAFLRQARALGCHTIDGSGMAVFQAAAAFELFTGLAPDPDRMRATFDSFT